MKTAGVVPWRLDGERGLAQAMRDRSVCSMIQQARTVSSLMLPATTGGSTVW